MKGFFEKRMFLISLFSTFIVFVLNLIFSKVKILGLGTWSQISDCI